MKNKSVKLTDSELHRIVNESINNVVKETSLPINIDTLVSDNLNEYYDLIAELKKYLETAHGQIILRVDNSKQLLDIVNSDKNQLCFYKTVADAIKSIQRATYICRMALNDLHRGIMLKYKQESLENS